MLGLGRIPSVSDSRDYDFLLGAELTTRGIEETTTGSVLHACPVVYDQGPTQHCVGFSGAGFLTCQSAARAPGVIDSFDAEALYQLANASDGISGVHEGSTVRAGFQALRTAGDKVTSSNRADLAHTFELSSYLWASPVDDDDPHLAEVKTWVLTVGPLWIGSEWSQSMFTVDAQGLVIPSGASAGGHAYLLRGYDSSSDMFVGRTSWGSDFGGTASQVGSDSRVIVDMSKPASDFLLKASDVAGLLANGGEAGTCLAADVAVT